MKPSLGIGVYSIDDAAMFTGVPVNTLRKWFRGRDPVFEPDYGHVGPRQPLSFHDLIGALNLARMRHRGLSMQYLRRVLDAAKRQANTKHGFAHSVLLLNGKELLFAEMPHADAHDRAKVTDIFRPNQLIEKGLIAPSIKDIMFADISVGSDQLANEWTPAPGLVVNPRRNFGAPTLVGSGVAARVLHDAWVDNDRDVSVVANWYKLPIERVERAIEFVRGKMPGRAA